MDGLIAPQYCGDFQEVLQAFKSAQPQLNLEKIVTYVLRLDTAIAKRLGWILEKMEIKESRLIEKILAIPVQGYRKLDPSGGSEGPYNKKWKIRENIGG